MWALSFDLGGTALKYALVSRTGDTIAPGVVPSRAQDGRTAVLGQIRHAGRSLLDISRKRDIRPVAIGLGTPGTVDQQNGTVGGALPNMPGWRGTNVIDAMMNELGLPCFAENDANVMILAEALCGAAKELSPVFGVTLGTGIGGGLIIDGQIYRGAGCAGEIGHTSVDAHGSICKCGLRGCLELYAAASCLTGRYRVLTDCTIAPSLVLDRWTHGDTAADDAVTVLARWIGIGVGNALNLLHPACLVLGGGLMEAGDRFFETVRASILEHCLPAVAGSVLVRRAFFGNQAGVVGAGLFALQCYETQS